MAEKGDNINSNSNNDVMETNNMVESISQMSISTLASSSSSPNSCVYEEVGDNNNLNNSKVISTTSNNISSCTVREWDVTGSNSKDGVGLLCLSPIQVVYNNNTNGNNSLRNNKRARMLGGLAIPLIVGNEWLGGTTGGADNNNNHSNNHDSQQQHCGRTISDYSDTLSPPESPLAGANAHLRQVFRRVGQEDDNIPPSSNTMEQRTPRMKNTGLSISTSLDWQPTDQDCNTPIAPKNKRPFKSFWVDFLPGLSTQHSPIVAASKNVSTVDSFSIGCNTTTHIPGSTKSNNSNKHSSASSSLCSFMRQNQTKSNRLTICRRLRKVIQLPNNNNNNIMSVSPTVLQPQPQVAITLTDSTTSSTTVQRVSLHKRKASNGTRLSKFRMRNSEHFASL